MHFLHPPGKIASAKQKLPQTQITAPGSGYFSSRNSKIIFGLQH
jgi:hypothetical protein